MIEIISTTREVVVPDEDLVFGVTSDELSSSRNFKMERHTPNGMDLKDFAIKINYINANSEVRSSVAENVHSDDEFVYFDWVFSRNATRYMGSIQFIVCCRYFDEDGHLTNEWNSAIGKGIVKQGIEIEGDEITDAELAGALDRALQQIHDAEEESVMAIRRASDEELSGFVKKENLHDTIPMNVTFEDPIEILPETMFNFVKDGENEWYGTEELESPILRHVLMFRPDVLYKVTWDGEVYLCHNEGHSLVKGSSWYEWDAFGNASIVGAVDSYMNTQEPFCIERDFDRNSGEIRILTSSTEATHSVKVEGLVISAVNVHKSYYEQFGKWGKPPVWAGTGRQSTMSNFALESSGDGSHAEGGSTTASGDHAHAEGEATVASGRSSHAEGYKSTASSTCAHVEGYACVASNQCTHAEGLQCTAVGLYSHAEGRKSKADGQSAHAEGDNCAALAKGAHAEGACSEADKTALYGHAEGYWTTAYQSCSHVEGYYTEADGHVQHVQGQYNIRDAGDLDMSKGGNGGRTYLHIVGNGLSEDTRSNAHTVDWDGNCWYSGDIYVGSDSGTHQDEGSKKVATEEYVRQVLENFRQQWGLGQ